MGDQMHRAGRIGVLVCGLVALCFAPASTIRADEDPRRPDVALDVPEPASAFRPLAPELPAEIVGALQEARYDDAVNALQPLAEDADASSEDRSYYALILGIAHRLGGDLDRARTSWPPPSRRVRRAPGRPS